MNVSERIIIGRMVMQGKFRPNREFNMQQQIDDYLDTLRCGRAMMPYDRLAAKVTNRKK